VGGQAAGHEERVMALWWRRRSHKGETLRVDGRARVNADPATLSRFEVRGVAPRLVLVVTVEAAYECARAVVRSDLRNPERHVARGGLPTPGKIQ